MHEARMSTGPLSIDFSGYRVLVTGGSRGIAGEIARLFVRNAATVAVNYSAAADTRAGRADAARELVEEMRAMPGAAYAHEANLACAGEARRLVHEVTAVLGGIDILVLSASLQIHKDFLEMDETDVSAQLQMNLVANRLVLRR